MKLLCYYLTGSPNGNLLSFINVNRQFHIYHVI